MELTAAELWARIQETARGAVPAHGFETWIGAPTALALSADELTVKAPTPFHVEWVEDKYGPLLSSAAQRILGRPIKIRVVYDEEDGPIPVPSLELGPPEASHERASPEPAPSAGAPPPSLNERYTFERFVVGANCQLAAAAARAVADAPARMYNPLFLYGGVGLGKTHLMHAIGHEIVATGPRSRVAYVSTEQFTNALVTSIQEGTMPAFRRRYRQMDLLLVDDVQFLKGKEATQDEFFHTFNALYDAHKQIILTSDRPPKELSGLEERLISRFQWGLVVDVKAPAYETRMAILRKKAADDGITLEDEVLDLIARHCTASVRELEGAVIKLLAYSSLTHQEVTPQLTRVALREMLGRNRDRGPVLSPERIREIVASRWRVRPEALESKRRTKDLTVPRQVAMYLIKETLGTPLVRIGTYFGGRDHSTVIHSIRKVEEDMQRDPAFRRQVDDARFEIEGPPTEA